MTKWRLLLFITVVAFFFFCFDFSRPLVLPLAQISGLQEKPLFWTEPLPLSQNECNSLSGISAESFLVTDLTSGSVLCEKNADQSLPMASLTKLMSAWVSLQNCYKESLVEVSEFETVGSQMGLSSGEVVSVENLLWGLLLNSGNDSASVLGFSCQSDEMDFVSEMNQWTKFWSMDQTSFRNTVGLDEEGHFTSVRDLSRLSRIIFQHNFLSEVIKSSSRVVQTAPESEIKRWYFLQSTHPLAGEPYYQGGKTGYTQKAKECLITRITEKNRDYLIIFLASDDREKDIRTFYNYFFNL